ncbi:uncharacterized protein N0V89_008287 [Didymosphaeria variabile]|uniref:Uncharacterized protein n=1 Tax=Didymosphaeria variabile TaxID=1932322 RepID=A0A9W9C7N4_9PLEO|nr:uncharacterized protein N0V89_008287 [Didymosphaeria variabile]KAJ4349670.1 hypothetical protein N0V89_008287 [Didymosphaeria variabile]
MIWLSSARNREGVKGKARVEGGNLPRKRARDDNDNNGEGIHIRPRKRRRSGDSWWVIEQCTWLFCCIEFLLHFNDTPAAIGEDERNRISQEGREQQFMEHPNYITVGGRRVYVADAGFNVIPHSGTGAVRPNSEIEGQPKTATPTWPPKSYPYAGDPVADPECESPETPPGMEDECTQTTPPPSDSDGEDDDMPAPDVVAGGIHSSPPTKTQAGGHIVVLPGDGTHFTGPLIRQQPMLRKDNKGRFWDKEDRLVDSRGRLINESGQLIDEQGRIPHHLLRDDPPPQPFASIPPRRDSQGRLLHEQGYFVKEEAHLVNSNGQLVDDKGQLVDEHGRIPAHLFEDDRPIPKRPPRLPEAPTSRPPQVPSKPPQVPPQPSASAPSRRDEQGRLLGEDVCPVNDQGHLVNERGLHVDEQGRLVDGLGRLINALGQLVNTKGQLVNTKGQLVDAYGSRMIEETPADKPLPPGVNKLNSDAWRENFKEMGNQWVKTASSPSPITTSTAVGPTGPSNSPADPTSFLDRLPSQQQQPGGRLPAGFDDAEEGEDPTTRTRGRDRQYRPLPPNDYVIRGSSLGRYGLPLAPDMVVQDEERPVPPLGEKYMDRFTFPPRKCAITQHDEPCNEIFTNGRALREHQLTHDYMMSGGAGPGGTIDPETEDQFSLPEGEADRLLRERQVRKMIVYKGTALQKAALENYWEAKETKEAEERAGKAKERAEAPLTEEDFLPEKMTQEEFEKSLDELPSPDASEEGLTEEQQAEFDGFLDGVDVQEGLLEEQANGKGQLDPFLTVFSDEELQRWAEEENDMEYPDPYA